MTAELHVNGAPCTQSVCPIWLHCCDRLANQV